MGPWHGSSRKRAIMTSLFTEYSCNRPDSSDQALLKPTPAKPKLLCILDFQAFTEPSIFKISKLQSRHILCRNVTPQCQGLWLASTGHFKFYAIYPQLKACFSRRSERMDCTVVLLFLIPTPIDILPEPRALRRHTFSHHQFSHHRLPPLPPFFIKAPGDKNRGS
jgi:hypothetical protein